MAVVVVVVLAAAVILSHSDGKMMISQHQQSVCLKLISTEHYYYYYCLYCKKLFIVVVQLISMLNPCLDAVCLLSYCSSKGSYSRMLVTVSSIHHKFILHIYAHSHSQMFLMVSIEKIIASLMQLLLVLATSCLSLLSAHLR